MRRIMVFFLLLLPLLAKADWDTWGVKPSLEKTMQVYWINTTGNDFLQELLDELTGFSWQKQESVEQLLANIETETCAEILLIWQGNDYDEHLLLVLAKQAVTVLLIAETLPENMQRKLASLGSVPAWLNSEQDHALIQKQVRHRILQLRHQQAYRLANMRLQGLHLLEKQAFLLKQKPMANQRWFAEIYALSEQNPIEENTFWLQADGRLLDEDFMLDGRELSRIQARTLLIAEHGSFDDFPAMQWQDIFPFRHDNYDNLQAFLELETLSQLIEPLVRFLQGRSIYQQQHVFALADSPQSASLALKQGDNIKLFYQASDGALHQWRFLSDQAYHWHTVYPRGALLLSPDVLWDVGKRERFYSGQLSAVQNQQQNKAWLFASSGLAEQGLYAYDVSGENPKLAWHKTVSDLPSLAWTFNKMTALGIAYSQQEKQAVLVGAGFDAAYRDAKQRPEIANQGNAVYLLNAENGELLWQLRYGENIGSSNTTFTHPELKHAIAASFSLNKKRDTAFVGDMGGQIWRISLPKCQGSACLNLQYRQQHWQAEVIAQSAAIESGFFHAVAVWEKPRKTYIAAINSSAWQSGEQAAKVFFFPAEQTVDLDSLPNLVQCEQARCDQGWHYGLAQGEKLYAEPVIWQDNLYVLSYQENPQACSFVADTYTLYRFKLGENSAAVEVKPIAEGSLYLTVNKNTIAALAPAIERWLSGSDAVESVHSLLESFDNETGENGIVITSWREYFY